MWDVRISKAVAKRSQKLPKAVYVIYKLLLAEIEQYGPERTKWKNYGMVRGGRDCHHCHLKKGRPTYVAVWRVANRENQEVEVTYVGTHAKADYKRRC